MSEQQFYSATVDDKLVIGKVENFRSVEVFVYFDDKGRQCKKVISPYFIVAPIYFHGKDDVVIRGVTKEELFWFINASPQERKDNPELFSRLFKLVDVQLSEAETFTTTVSNSRLNIPLKVGEKVEVTFPNPEDELSWLMQIMKFCYEKGRPGWGDYIKGLVERLSSKLSEANTEGVPFDLDYQIRCKLASDQINSIGKEPPAKVSQWGKGQTRPNALKRRLRSEINNLRVEIARLQSLIPVSGENLNKNPLIQPAKVEVTLTEEEAKLVGEFLDRYTRGRGGKEATQLRAIGQFIFQRLPKPPVELMREPTEFGAVVEASINQPRFKGRWVALGDGYWCSEPLVLGMTRYERKWSDFINPTPVKAGEDK